MDNNHTFKPKIEDYLNENNEHFKVNNCLYRYLLNNQAIDDFCDHLTDILDTDININQAESIVFYIAYDLVDKIKADTCQQAHIHDYHYYAFEKIISSQNLTVETISLAFGESVMELASVALCVAFCLLDLPYDVNDPKTEYPEHLKTMLSIELEYAKNFPKKIQRYLSFIRNNQEWLAIKTDYIKRSKREEQRDFPYEQKIVVELLKELFKRYNINFKTAKEQAEIITIITGYNQSKVQSLLSSPSTIIPGRYKEKVNTINDLLKDMGINVILSVKE